MTGYADRKRMGASEVRCYGLLGSAIAVECDIVGTHAWLAEFLTPAFEIRPAAEADLYVAILADNRAYERAAATRPKAPLDDVNCFALDSSIKARRAWSVAGETIVEDDKHGVLWRLVGKRVEVLIGRARERCRIETMRVIREIATACVLASADRLQLHAAALESGGRALLVAGPKGAGKTTLLCYLAMSTRAGMIANDRVIVSRDAGFDVRGVPTIVSVRPGTSRLLPCSFDTVPRVARPVQLTLAEADAARRNVGSVDAGDHLYLSPAQFARALGISLSPSGRLAAIAFPQSHTEAGGLAVDRLKPDAAEQWLRAARFGLGSGKNAATVFERLVDGRRSAGADESLVAALAGTVPCVVVRIGAHLFSRPDAARAVLAACLGA